jgi:hypothetical protein
MKLLRNGSVKKYYSAICDKNDFKTEQKGKEGLHKVITKSAMHNASKFEI